MDAFLSKIENFLFDILGLVLPGLIFILVILFPIFLFDLSKIPVKKIDSSFILSELLIVSKITKNYWQKNEQTIIYIVLVVSYLVGHLIKVLSIIFYEILESCFDKSINVLVIYIAKLIKNGCNIIYGAIFATNSNINSSILYRIVETILKPFLGLISKIFTFKSESYFSDNEPLINSCISKINTATGTTFPSVWYSIFKLSTVIINQENLKTLSGNFLAKYNLYRSLSFVFVVATVYYYLFFKVSADFIPHELKKINLLVLTLSILLWFSFHYKFKRYWTLCGNETLMSLFYFLHKKKLNEN